MINKKKTVLRLKLTKIKKFFILLLFWRLKDFWNNRFNCGRCTIRMNYRSRLLLNTCCKSEYIWFHEATESRTCTGFLCFKSRIKNKTYLKNKNEHSVRHAPYTRTKMYVYLQRPLNVCHGVNETRTIRYVIVVHVFLFYYYITKAISAWQ